MVLLVLLPTYLGPYLYVYGRTQSNVFPTVEQGDKNALDRLLIRVDNRVIEVIERGNTGIVSGQPVTWSDVTYAVSFGVFNRIFKTYINFPALVGVSKLSFQATGVFNGTTMFVCSHYIDSLIAPTGFEVIAVFGSILSAGNNTIATAFCHGPGSPLLNLAQLSQKYMSVVPITLSWVLDATVKGEKVEATREWTGTQSENLLSL